MYWVGEDFVLRKWLTLEELEWVLNDCYSGACGGHMFGYAIAQNILLTNYFWPSNFKDCILAVQKYHECQIFNRKQCAPPTPLHLVITVGPFAKWGIDFMTCNPCLAKGHGYITIAIDYFTKWAEAMPTYNVDSITTTPFLFDHVITRFGVPKAIVTEHGSHFCQHIMAELTA